MKNFKNYINESTQKYTFEELVAWCKENIIGFDITSEKKSNKGFVISDENQEIIRTSVRGNIDITTKDTYLPLNVKFVCENGYILDAPNLLRLNIDNFSFSHTTGHLVDMSFINMSNFDFSTIKMPKSAKTFFIECNNVTPLDLKVYNGYVDFDCSENKHLYDFNNFNNSFSSLIMKPYHKYKNMQNIIVGNNIDFFYIEPNALVYDVSAVRKLNVIMKSYLSRNDKKDATMDFALEMIDEGFEEEL